MTLKSAFWLLKSVKEAFDSCQQRVKFTIIFYDCLNYLQLRVIFYSQILTSVTFTAKKKKTIYRDKARQGKLTIIQEVPPYTKIKQGTRNTRFSMSGLTGNTMRIPAFYEAYIFYLHTIFSSLLHHVKQHMKAKIMREDVYFNQEMFIIVL